MDMIVDIAWWLFAWVLFDLLCFMVLTTIYGDAWKGTKISRFARHFPCGSIALLLYFLGRNPPKERS